jgi:DNA-binding NtrC family response regulator
MYMAFISAAERSFLTAVSEFAYCNPFLPEHTRLEREALGDEFVEGEPVWSQMVEDPERPRANVWRIFEKLKKLAEELRTRLISGKFTPREADLMLYEDAILHLLYQSYYRQFNEASFGATSKLTSRWRFYHEFLSDWRRFLEIDGVQLPTRHDPRHTFACFRQIQRAFEQIFHDIIGGSMPAARLRASIWQSIFTHDMRRYRRTLFGRMGEFATLITGPSGTGKELAARAIAQSRYAPFDDKRIAFADDDTSLFFPINISALSPTLVESELFGHRRGSFTGAIEDRKGWLETCPALGSVFLDELGDLDPAIQVKLLRVIETRSFHPVGETAARQFQGKLIAATNRDLAARIRTGEFREDLYYRLCSDQIVTPSLAEQLADSRQVLNELIMYMARRVAGAEADELARDVTVWIEENLGRDYPWPGNYRELEQCVKNVLIRRDYRPSSPVSGHSQMAGHAPRPAPSSYLAGHGSAPLGLGTPDAMSQLIDDFCGGRTTVNELLARYCTIVYRINGSYEETARRIGLDRRTVKNKIDRELLARLVIE